MTDAGFPMMAHIHAPVVYALNGSIKTKYSPVSPVYPTITAKVIPVVNGKIQSIYGLISPFTNELIAAGVDASLHSTIPLEVEASIVSGEAVLKIRTPNEIERSGSESEILHLSMKPFTIKKDILTVSPFCGTASMKFISSGAPRHPIDIPIGQSLGLYGRLQIESDAKFGDLMSYLNKIGKHSPLSFVHMAVIPSSVRDSTMRLVYHPTKSQTKEFTIAIRLTTKGFKPRFSAGPINAHSLRHLSSVHNVLSQLTSSPSSAVSVVEVTASRTGPSVSKSVKAVLVAGKTSTGQFVMTSGAIGYQSTTGATYGIQYEGTVQLPELTHRWLLEEVINEPLKLVFDGKLTIGKEIVGQKMEFVLNTILEKTESLKASILESLECSMCLKEQQKGRKLSPMCNALRHQAASLNKVELTLTTPPSIATSSYVSIIGDIIRSLVIRSNVDISPVRVVSTPVGVNSVKVVLEADRVSELAQGLVITPATAFKVNNIRLYGLTTGILPLSILDGLTYTVPRKLTGNLIPSTCRVEPGLITTFDNKTLDFALNDCEHVLLMDKSKKLPVAVTARTVPEQRKLVRIVSGVTEISMIPVAIGMEIRINNVLVPVAPGSTVIRETVSVRSKKPMIAAVVKRFKDNTYMVTVPAQSLTVLTDGISIEIVAPHFLKSRTVGLCGDMNGEATADLKTPQMCVMRSKLAAFSYVLNKSGSRSSAFSQCSGVPAPLLKELEEESMTCAMETIVPTNVIGLYNKLDTLIKPTGMTHLVSKPSPLQTCISKQMVKFCSGSELNPTRQTLSNPLSIKPLSVEFVCLPSTTMQVQSFERRAWAGESLFMELGQLPTFFRRVEFEPVICSLPSL